jgi:hypothetical protein
MAWPVLVTASMNPCRVACASFLGLSVVACRDRGPPPSSLDVASAAPPAVDSVESRPIDVFEAESLESARRWQGSWVVRDADYPGSIQAWGVDGDAVTVYDGRTKRQRRDGFALLSPCRLTRTRSLGVDPYLDGSPSEGITTADTFVFSSDGLHVAMSPAAGGFRRGPLVTACVGSHLYAFDVGTSVCQTWNEEARGPALTPRMECAIDASVAPTSFVLRPGGGGVSVRLPFYGDALLSPELLVHIAEAEPSFHDATRRVDAITARDPG